MSSPSETEVQGPTPWEVERAKIVKNAEAVGVGQEEEDRRVLEGFLSWKEQADEHYRKQQAQIQAEAAAKHVEAKNTEGEAFSSSIEEVATELRRSRLRSQVQERLSGPRGKNPRMELEEAIRAQNMETASLIVEAVERDPKLLQLGEFPQFQKMAAEHLPRYAKKLAAEAEAEEASRRALRVGLAAGLHRRAAKAREDRLRRSAPQSDDWNTPMGRPRRGRNG